MLMKERLKIVMGVMIIFHLTGFPTHAQGAVNPQDLGKIKGMYQKALDSIRQGVSQNKDLPYGMAGQQLSVKDLASINQAVGELQRGLNAALGDLDKVSPGLNKLIESLTNQFIVELMKELQAQNLPVDKIKQQLLGYSSNTRQFQPEGKAGENKNKLNEVNPDIEQRLKDKTKELRKMFKT